MNNKDINDAIIRSQHTQRNWDLSKSIPDDDMELLITAATQCPSKQNVAFYKVHFITDRDMIEDIHDTTRGFTTSEHPSGAETNTQTLANLVIMFEMLDLDSTLKDDTVSRNTHTRDVLENGWSEDSMRQLKRDAYTAVGVAAGYLNVVATLLGYSTGCCQCFNGDTLRQVTVTEGEPLLLMGIGYKDPDKTRRQHQTRDDFTFSTKKKQPIEVVVHD
jgi:nitroreductase